MKITTHINKARILAEKSKFSQYKMGCVIVKGKKIISTGYNRSSGKLEKIANKFQFNIWSLHAEMDALIKADSNANGAVMFISGVKINGNPINCKPCKHCQEVIKEFGIKIVVYSTKSGVEIMEIN